MLARATFLSISLFLALAAAAPVFRADHRLPSNAHVDSLHKLATPLAYSLPHAHDAHSKFDPKAQVGLEKEDEHARFSRKHEHRPNNKRDVQGWRKDNDERRPEGYAAEDRMMSKPLDRKERPSPKSNAPPNAKWEEDRRERGGHSKRDFYDNRLAAEPREKEEKTRLMEERRPELPRKPETARPEKGHRLAREDGPEFNFHKRDFVGRPAVESNEERLRDDRHPEGRRKSEGAGPHKDHREHDERESQFQKREIAHREEPESPVAQRLDEYRQGPKDPKGREFEHGEKGRIIREKQEDHRTGLQKRHVGQTDARYQVDEGHFTRPAVHDRLAVHSSAHKMDEARGRGIEGNRPADEGGKKW